MDKTKKAAPKKQYVVPYMTEEDLSRSELFNYKGAKGKSRSDVAPSSYFKSNLITIDTNQYVQLITWYKEVLMAKGLAKVPKIGITGLRAFKKGFTSYNLLTGRYDSHNKMKELRGYTGVSTIEEFCDCSLILAHIFCNPSMTPDFPLWVEKVFHDYYNLDWDNGGTGGSTEFFALYILLVFNKGDKDWIKQDIESTFTIIGNDDICVTEKFIIDKQYLTMHT